MLAFTPLGEHVDDHTGDEEAHPVNARAPATIPSESDGYLAAPVMPCGPPCEQPFQNAELAPSMLLRLHVFGTEALEKAEQNAQILLGIGPRKRAFRRAPVRPCRASASIRIPYAGATDAF
jgi:hypothetical protein